MKAIKRFVKTVPIWAFGLVLIAFTTNSVYLYFKYQIPEDTSTYKFENGLLSYDLIEPGSPDDKVGLKSGDILVSIDSIPIDTWNSDYKYALSAGDSVKLVILRYDQQLEITTKMTTMGSNSPGFYWSVFFVMMFFNIAGLFILYKRPKDKTVVLFFIYLQLFSVTVNALSLTLPFPLSVAATWIFQVSGLFMGPVLVHFHLLFPRPSRAKDRLKQLPWVLYAIASFIFIPYAASCYLVSFNPEKYVSLYSVLDRISLLWISLNFCLALSIAILQYNTMKDTLSRNQVRLVIIGSFFGFITPITYGLFYQLIDNYNDYARLVMVPHGIGSLIMIICVLTAIFRYRIWDTEIIIRKALLYLAATIIITLSYLFLIYLTDRIVTSETNLSRFITLALSVMIFIIFRDWMQRQIDRLFHRETYDSATVVSDFEENLAGIYRYEELKIAIIQGLDRIFHFKSMIFSLKKMGLIYEPVSIPGINDINLSPEYQLTKELEEKLQKSAVFSPAELEWKIDWLDMTGGELIIPILNNEQPFGFFLCGPKKSEKTYSMQDIRVLSLIAKRVVTLFQTATLYQKDLDRQLTIERERARIAQDMHDDVGAGLTKIAMISEQGQVTGEKMQKVAANARDMINRLNVIVWALNPQYDNLESLISYARRYFGEFLENFEIGFSMEITENIPNLSVSPDFRRNVFNCIQEAIHNAVKHSSCSQISLIVRIMENQMEVIIKDNGKGFDNTRSDSGRNGLINMRKRAEELGGTFGIESTTGKGTRVKFAIPLGL